MHPGSGYTFSAQVARATLRFFFLPPPERDFYNAAGPVPKVSEISLRGLDARRQNEEDETQYGGVMKRIVKVLGRAALAAAWTAVFLQAHTARAQVVPSADAGGYRISAGGMVSGFKLGYDQRKLGGYSVFVDVDTIRGLGVEGEAHWLELNKFANEHVETYSAGLRYHRNWGKSQPYVKGLIGFGDMNFPYDYATGRYTVLTLGGGLDYRLSRRIYLRAADLEYQNWPEFTFGSMSNVGVSTGIRVRIF